MHLCCQSECLLVELVAFQQPGHEFLAGVVAIDIHRKGGQRHQIDAVALLKRCQVGVAQRQSQHIADAGIVTRCCSHPQHVVIAPLYVPGVVLPQGVHDDMCAGSSVVDVAKDVQLVDGQALYDVAEGHDEVVGTSC